MERLLDIIGPAIVVVEKMEGVWQSFAGDFHNMLSEITQDVGSANSIIAGMVEKKFEAKWSDVAGASKQISPMMLSGKLTDRLQSRNINKPWTSPYLYRPMERA